MVTRRFEYFFDLPPEIREHILSYICLFPGGVLVGGGVGGANVPAAGAAADLGASPKHAGGALTSRDEGHDDADDDDDDDERDQVVANPPLDLFLASPFFYREAGDLYYGRNAFHLDFGGLSSSSSTTTAVNSSAAWGRRRNMRRWQQWQRDEQDNESGRRSGDTSRKRKWGGSVVMRLLTDADAAGARGRIRSVVCYIARFGALTMGHVVPALTSMVLGGELKRVRVDVREGAKGGRQQALRGMVNRGLDLTGNPALKSLLVLLTDPDIERGQLRVSRRFHTQFWCQFHCEAGCVTSRSNTSDEEDGGHGGDFLEVDIYKLVQTLGQGVEFRIKKVGNGRVL
ncbi:hypothetical protein MMYC01_204129 [Madurella mycetomatis]|uniref:Uncharacterized protein n=1 Tax=Madurella mycetomatis TaxID=100816 RepID=A0A175W9F9_9PEZI|nr:hypothetical protein MMYC01_204129 [Madurella mycetomatis]